MTQDIAANAQAIKDEADRAKAAEKVNADAIAVLNGVDTVEGSVAKAVKDAKDAVMTEVNKKVAQADYDTKVAALEKADTDNLAAAKKYTDDQDAEIEAILGHKAEGDQAATGLCADVAANAAAIAAEVTARKNADTALDGRLDTIEGEGEGSIKKALADAKAYADAEDKKIEDLLGTKDDATTKDTAFGRIAKEVARAKAAEEALGGRIDTANGKITALENALDAEETGLKARMTAAETDIDNLQSDMRTAQGDINNINADITNINNKLLNLVPLTDGELMAMLNQVYAK